MNCKYCNTILKTKQSLQIHQKKVKYCLKIQKEKKEKKNKSKKWKSLLSTVLSFRNEEIINKVIEEIQKQKVMLF